MQLTNFLGFPSGIRVFSFLLSVNKICLHMISIFSFLWHKVLWIGVSYFPTFLLQKNVELHFLTQGSHLGAVGALINNVKHFISQDGKVANGDLGSAKSKTEKTTKSKTENKD